MTKEKGYRKILFCMLTVMMSLLLTACGISMKQHVNGTAAMASPTPGIGRTFRGVVTKNDTEIGQLEIRELDSEVVSNVNYTARSVITDSYEKQIDGAAVEVGQIYDITYDESTAHLLSAVIPKEVWEYEDVSTFAFSSDESMLRVAGSKYQYGSQTFFDFRGNPIEPMELNTEDVLTVRGIGIHVYSVVCTAGHGYIRMENYKNFLGGIVQIGDRILLRITENMLITAPEGTYRITLSKGKSTGSKMVTVTSDQEVMVDFSDCKVEESGIAKITFDIEPAGADLYMNSTLVDYSNPVLISYGKYRITVSMTGYKTYSGILDAEDPEKKIHISLTEGSDEELTTATPKTSPAVASASPSVSNSTNDDNTVTKKIDSKHTITVLAPEGAEVFLDNVYKGLAPCKFTKVIGSQTITLSSSGCETKSYSVDILDDGENVKLSFADLVKTAQSTATPQPSGK